MAAPTEELVRLHDLDFVPYMPEHAIVDRAFDVAKAISVAYAGRQLRRICVERGARYFFDLVDQFLWDLAPELSDTDSLRVSSYDGKQSTGTLLWLEPLAKPLEADLDVLLFEDIADTGRTGNRLLEFISPQVASLAFVTMLDKPEARIEPLAPAATGFVIPNLFVVGSGLDYKVGEVELGRDLPGVYALASEQPFADYHLGMINLPALAQRP